MKFGVTVLPKAPHRYLREGASARSTSPPASIMCSRTGTSPEQRGSRPSVCRSELLPYAVWIDKMSVHTRPFSLGESLVLTAWYGVAADERTGDAYRRLEANAA